MGIKCYLRARLPQITNPVIKGKKKSSPTKCHICVEPVSEQCAII